MTKTNNIKIVLLSLMVMLCLSLGLMTTKTQTTYAATPQYRLQYDYVAYCNNIKQTSGTSYNYAPKTSATTSSALIFYLTGPTSDGSSQDATKGTIFNFNTLYITSTLSMTSFNIYNSSGTSVKSGSGTSWNGTYADGNYTFSGKYVWSRTQRGLTTSWSYTISGSFSIDTTGPTISGASTTTNGKIVNSNTYISASDTISGVYSLYVKYPSNSSYTYLGNDNFTVTTAMTNGLYSFYATDRAGNRSNTYYIMLDTVGPTGTIKNGSNIVVSGNYINTDFYYSATDSIAGVKYYQYKTPNSSSWATYTAGNIIYSNFTNGTYQFKAIDNAGNVSAIREITLDTVVPTGAIMSSDGNVLTGDYTNGSFYYLATDDLSGLNKMEYRPTTGINWLTYTKGTIISETSGDGVYLFRATDNAGNVSESVSIVLDTEKPSCIIMSSSGPVSNGGRVSGDFISCSFTDTYSEIASIYVKKPASSNYVSYIADSQLAVEGTYCFYAKDNAGNISATYSVTLDKTAPTIGCLETELYSIYGLGFTVSVSDEAGTAKLYVKEPSSSQFVLSPATTSYTANLDSENGKYYFYGIDDLGNKTSIYWIDLEIVYPDPTIENSTTNNSVKVTWTNGSSATLNGNNYDKGTWITEEGDYTVVVTNEYGLQTTKQFSIVHNYVVVKEVEPTCTEGGYTIFRCSSCGDEYVGNVKNAIGHNYKEEVIEATCTTYGCIRYTCQNCGDVYEFDKTNALGHIYTEITREVTCTEDGGQVHTCIVCGYEYLTDVVKATGHDYLTEVTIEPHCGTCGERHFHCSKCEAEYYVDIPALDHNFELTDTIDDGNTITRRYVCTLCGAISEQSVDNYSEVANYMTYLYEQYSPYMIWVFIATAGIWSIVMGVMIILARKNEEKEKAKKMIANYLIGLVVISVILLGVPLIMSGVATLISG